MIPQPRGWIVQYGHQLEAIFHDLGAAERFVSSAHGKSIEYLYPLTREQLEWLAKMPETPALLRADPGVS